MSVRATLDLDSRQWSFLVEPEIPHPNVEIGFVGEEDFDNLSFGFSLRAGEEILFETSYPEEGTVYIRTDQQYVSSDYVRLPLDTRIDFDVWAENGGVLFESGVSFYVPKPPKPYPSWVWDEVSWSPPHLPPYDGFEYFWDESIKEWATVGTISEQGAD